MTIRNTAIAMLWILSSLGGSTVASQGLTQAQLNEAASNHLGSSEFMVRKAYEQLAEVLTADRLKLLESSQAQWTEYKEANLEVIRSGYAGGTILPLISAQRAIEMNENRTAELTKMYLLEVTP